MARSSKKLKALIVGMLVLLLSVPCHSAELKNQETPDSGTMLLKQGDQGECEDNVCKSEGFWNEAGKQEGQEGSWAENPYAFPEQKKGKGDERDGGGMNSPQAEPLLDHKK